jgi:hypothetical protein
MKKKYCLKTFLVASWRRISVETTVEVTEKVVEVDEAALEIIEATVEIAEAAVEIAETAAEVGEVVLSLYVLTITEDTAAAVVCMCPRYTVQISQAKVVSSSSIS